MMSKSCLCSDIFNSYVTLANNEKFLTIPIFWPYGVSDGQIIPK